MAGFYLLSEFLLEIFWKEIAEEIYIFFHISFWCLTWDANTGFMCNKPTHYLLDYGGFLCLYPLHKQKQLLGNCSTDQCNRDLQTTITLFKHTASSHKTDWTSFSQQYSNTGDLENIVLEEKCDVINKLLKDGKLIQVI